MLAHVFSRKRLSRAHAFDVILPLGRFHSLSTAPRVVVALLVPLAAGDVVRVVVRDPVRAPRRRLGGARGELCLKSVLVMREYWNKPDATAKELDADGESARE